MNVHFAIISAGLDAEPYYAGSTTPSGSIVTMPDGTIFVTHDGDDVYAVGIYGPDFVTEATEPTTVVEVSGDKVVDVVTYLTLYQPEGTDWIAWATQRLDDDGEACAR